MAAISPVEKEIQCVVHWFCGWSPFQKSDFLKELLDKAVPCNMDSLFDSMKGMNVRDKPPSIFRCQLKLFGDWFAEWTDKERNDFMIRLQQIDPEFMAKFNELVEQGTGAAGAS